MSFRSAQIFVQPKTARLLRLVTKLYPFKSGNAPPESINQGDINRTPDELADTLIRVAIVEKYPLAIELTKKQDALEKEYTDKAKQ